MLPWPISSWCQNLLRTFNNPAINSLYTSKRFCTPSIFFLSSALCKKVPWTSPISHACNDSIPSYSAQDHPPPLVPALMFSTICHCHSLDKHTFFPKTHWSQYNTTSSFSPANPSKDHLISLLSKLLPFYYYAFLSTASIKILSAPLAETVSLHVNSDILIIL